MKHGPAGDPYRRPPIGRVTHHRAVPGDAGRRVKPTASPPIEATHDPETAALVALGFTTDEVAPLVARARAEREPDIRRYVMRSLIR